MKKLKILGILVLIAGILTTACALAEVGGTYVSGVSAGDAETLNWILAADSASFSYVGHTLDSLATYDNQFNVQLRCLAKPVQVSEDGLVYTVTIRDDLRWSDGSKVKAEDYVYTLENLMFSDWLDYTYKNDWQEMVNGKEVFVKPEVINETTFIIRRQTVDPEFFDNAILGLMPYPKHIAQKYEGDIEAFTQAQEFNNLTYTGNLGPYRFVEWVRNDKYVLARNPDYYLGKDSGAPYFDQYIVKLFGTPAARHAALEAGDVASIDIDPAHVAKFQQMTEKVNVYTVPTSGYLLLAYNLRSNGWEGFKKKEVRQAFSLAVSKELLVQQILMGFGDPAFSFIPKPSPWYSEDQLAQYGVKPLYDKEKAKELLGKAGYGIEGKPLKLVLVTNSGNSPRENAAFLIKQELVEIGIEVDLKLVPWPTLLRKYLMNKVPGTDQELRFNNGPEAVSEAPWDLLVIGFGTNPIAPSGQEVFYTTDGGLNFMGYFNPGIDELFRRVKSKEALDKEIREKIYAEISRVISEEQPVNFLVFQKANSGFQKKVKGIDPGINMGYNYHTWYFK